jgi:hypothetical protein
MMAPRDVGLLTSGSTTRIRVIPSRERWVNPSRETSRDGFTRIRVVLPEEAMGRSDAVIIIGVIGPTRDVPHGRATPA